MEQLNKQLLSEANRLRYNKPVRITVPASVAYDLDKFQTAVANLAERLGCKPCLSGAACIFSLETEFVINPANLELEEVGGRFLGG